MSRSLSATRIVSVSAALRVLRAARLAAGLAVSAADADDLRAAGFFAAVDRLDPFLAEPLVTEPSWEPAGAAAARPDPVRPPLARFGSVAEDVVVRRAVPVLLVPDLVVIVAPLAALSRRSW
ncbi:hypothetical protein AB0I55_16000 [Actinocatenispora sera]|uniref:hypothetical protein n=1 Tax=Actinocatenispora sera TaxID=390989 RepID=UPI001FD38229|nr:hypothetical protein [Actinocatenispora sera]